MERNGPQRGFTLAELLIVIVILGVLGAIAIPRFSPQKEKAYVAEAVNLIGAIRQGEIGYRLEHSGYIALDNDDDWSVIGIGNPNDLTDAKFSYEVTCDGGDCATGATITATQEADGDHKDETITLTVEKGEWGGGHSFRPRNTPVNDSGDEGEEGES